MANDKLSEITRRFRHFIAGQGWSICDEKAIAYGYQFTVTDGQSKVPVALYATGKILVQGKASALQAVLKTWDQPGQPQQNLISEVTLHSLTTAPTTRTLPGANMPQATGVARIGSDESGKGDFYGPLVIASVFVDKQSEQQLLQLGVRDSKKLTDKNISTIANEIRRLSPYKILTYLPAAYNQLYQRLSNLNLLLAQAHAKVITEIASNVPAQLAIVDQFGDEELVRQALQKTGCHLRLEQRHRAEDDTAVAAASILARAEFVRELARLSESVGVQLPKGASNPQIVTVGRQIVAQRGADALRNIAKLHFKTTATILEEE